MHFVLLVNISLLTCQFVKTFSIDIEKVALSDDNSSADKEMCTTLSKTYANGKVQGKMSVTIDATYVKNKWLTLRLLDDQSICKTKFYFEDKNNKKTHLRIEPSFDGGKQNSYEITDDSNFQFGVREVEDNILKITVKAGDDVIQYIDTCEIQDMNRIDRICYSSGINFTKLEYKLH